MQLEFMEAFSITGAMIGFLMIMWLFVTSIYTGVKDILSGKSSAEGSFVAFLIIAILVMIPISILALILQYVVNTWW